MEPIYTEENTNSAFQLNWSVALFAKDELPEPYTYLDALKATVESDGVRVLSLNRSSANTLQFFISTRPESAPSDIVRSIKGRLQYLIRDEVPRAFRRNYHIQSVGEANANLLDSYVAGQPKKHRMADEGVQARLESVQHFDEDVDLSKPLIGNYGQYLNSLQVVIETTYSWHEVREAQLQRVREIIVQAARKKSWRLRRVGLLSNHIHVLVGVAVTESPQSVALSLMNNVAYVYGMKPTLKFSYYVGTFGGYDRGAIRMRE